jgi:3',5'-cyclic-nucleotide phosphodiesterase
MNSGNKSLDWESFFHGLKNAFYHKKVQVELDNNKTAGTNNSSSTDICILGLALDLPNGLGRGEFKLKLRTVKDRWGAITNSFLDPLYQFYSIRTESSPTEKVDELEKQLKMLKEKHQFLERKHNLNKPTEQQAPAAQTPTKKRVKKEDTAPSNMTSEEVMKFLKEMKKKFIQTKACTENELDSLNAVLNTLSQNQLHKIELDKKISKEYDAEVIAWIKKKYSVDQETTKRSKKDNKEPTVSNAEFKKNMDMSTIEKEKTRQDVVKMFETVDQWNFDVFLLDELTEGQTLFITSYTLFVKYDLLSKFNLNEQVLINFLRKVESGYHDVPYHNAMHAADVLQSMHYIITKGGLSQYMSDEDILASLIASIVHDYDHPGLNNGFQINAQSYLATLYNDRSVLEQHHCAQAFEIMRSKDSNILQFLQEEQVKDVRESIIQMVLSTDMSQHGKIVSMFKGRLDADSDFSSKDDVRLALQIAIKLADVSNSSRPPALYLKWAQRLEQEFYVQGDKERELSLAISPFMDRTKPSLNNLQNAFISYIVSPMVQDFIQLLPNMKFTMDHIEENKQYWTTHESIEEAS